MTVKDRTKTFARRLQAATGTPYAACRQQVEQWEEGARDEAAYRVAEAELTAISQQVAATFPDGSLIYKWEDVGMYVYAATFQKPDNNSQATTNLEIGYLDGYLGYTWWINGELHVMANLFHNGEQITSTMLIQDHEAAQSSIREAITWLVTGFAEHPDRYDDTGRPASSLQDPIFE